MRLRRSAVLVAIAVALVGCGNGDGTTGVTAESLQAVEDCLVEEGSNANDIIVRYRDEPAFRRGLDVCTGRAGMTSEALLETQRDADRAHTAQMKRVAACMEGKGRPMELEILPDVPANFGDISRYFTPDTLDEFFDDYADCNNSDRGAFPTEAEMGAARKAKEAG